MKRVRLASDRVLVIDDEPEYLGWLAEFLKSLRLKPEFITNLEAGLTALEASKYRLILLDMTIPGDVSRYGEIVNEPIVEKFPGLVLANRARSLGYGAHQVIAYTVHDDDSIQAELDKLNCRYVLKGRPQVLKSVVRSSLESPPSRLEREPVGGAEDSSGRRSKQAH